MDNHTKEQRHYNMSNIKSADTKPEEFVRKYLFANGFRFRKNDSRYAGRPDIVLPKYKTVIFINGCFWHMHNCSRGRMPLSNQDYWIPKIHRNIERDKNNITKLEAMGWKVIIIWECELKKGTAEKRLKLLCDEIKNKY